MTATTKSTETEPPLPADAEIEIEIENDVEAADVEGGALPADATRTVNLGDGDLFDRTPSGGSLEDWPPAPSRPEQPKVSEAVVAPSPLGGNAWVPSTWNAAFSGLDYVQSRQAESDDFAIFGGEGRAYRYLVGRKIPVQVGHTQAGSRLVVVTDCPGEGDADLDDRAIKDSWRVANRLGYAEVMVVSLFAARVASKVDLDDHVDPVGPLNEDVWREAFLGATTVLAAWGGISPAQYRRHVDRCTATLAKAGAMHFGLIGSQSAPRHITAVDASDELLPLRVTRSATAGR